MSTPKPWRKMIPITLCYYIFTNFFRSFFLIENKNIESHCTFSLHDLKKERGFGNASYHAFRLIVALSPLHYAMFQSRIYFFSLLYDTLNAHAVGMCEIIESGSPSITKALLHRAQTRDFVPLPNAIRVAKIPFKRFYNEKKKHSFNCFK